MPPKATDKAPRRSVAGSPDASVPTLSLPKSPEGDDEPHLPALAALLSTSANPRRANYEKRFKELSDLVLSSDATYRISARDSISEGLAATSGATLSEDYFPTLQVGFIARAMGLNLSEEQVVQLVQLTEHDAASRGTVSRRRLEGVIVDALMTGVLGGSSLVQRGVLTEAEFPAGWRPSCCLREDERTIFNAFAAIDTTRKGYLTVDELRLAMTTMGDPLSSEEMEEMLVAFAEPGSANIYYWDLAAILAHE